MFSAFRCTPSCYSIKENHKFPEIFPTYFTANCVSQANDHNLFGSSNKIHSHFFAEIKAIANFTYHLTGSQYYYSFRSLAGCNFCSKLTQQNVQEPNKVHRFSSRWLQAVPPHIVTYSQYTTPQYGAPFSHGEHVESVVIFWARVWESRRPLGNTYAQEGAGSGTNRKLLFIASGSCLEEWVVQ